MAIQVIQRGPGLGANLGRALGLGGAQGFTQGLQNAKQAQALSSILGISPQEALSYGGLDPQVLKEVIKGKRLKNNALSEFIESEAGYEPNQSRESNLSEGVLSPKQEPNLKQMLDMITESKLQNLYQPQAELNNIRQEAAQVPKQSMKEESKSQKTELERFRDYLRKNKISLTPEQRKEAEGQILEKMKFEHKQKQDAVKERKKYMEKLADDYETSREQLQDLDRLEELNKEGKLDDSAWNEFLKESGIDVAALRNPESEEYQKTALGFLRSGRTIFGNRLTDFDVKQLLQMIPTLGNSPKGRARIISTLRRLGRGKELAYKAARDITRKNPLISSEELRDEVNERIEGPLNDLYKKFKKELTAMEKELPEGPTSAEIIASHLGGKLTKGVGRALEIAPPAAAGALIGSYLPGLGTLGGAGLGALYGLLNGGGSQPERTTVPRYQPPWEL